MNKFKQGSNLLVYLSMSKKIKLIYICNNYQEVSKLSSTKSTDVLGISPLFSVENNQNCLITQTFWVYNPPWVCKTTVVGCFPYRRRDTHPKHLCYETVLTLLDNYYLKYQLGLFITNRHASSMTF